MARRKGLASGIAPCASGAMMKKQDVTRKSLLQYGFIALPVAFAGFPLYILAPDFYATNYGISLLLLGGLLLFIRLFDAIQDPLIGWMTDRMQGKFVIPANLAAIVLCLSIFFLFSKPALPPAFWFMLCMLLSISTYSMLTIILGAQATLWTNDKNDQTRIIGARETFGLIGIVIAVSAPSLLLLVSGIDRVYFWYTVILAILMAGGVYGFWRFSRHNAPPAPAATGHHGVSLSSLRSLPSQSRRLFAVYGLSMLASSMPAVLVLFYIRDLLDAENLSGLFLLLYFISGIISMPLWRNASMQIGKESAWAISMFFAVTGFITAAFLGPGDVWPYALVCVFSGLALGADLTMPPSILADHIHANGNVTYAGRHYAFLSFIAKASLACASAIALPILDIAGFVPRADNSQAALTTLAVTYALIPCALKLMAAVLLYTLLMRSQSGGNDETAENHDNHRSSDYA